MGGGGEVGDEDGKHFFFQKSVGDSGFAFACSVVSVTSNLMIPLRFRRSSFILFRFLFISRGPIFNILC